MCRSPPDVNSFFVTFSSSAIALSLIPLSQKVHLLGHDSTAEGDSSSAHRDLLVAAGEQEDIRQFFASDR
jgi:hypothetical protein